MKGLIGLSVRHTYDEFVGKVAEHRERSVDEIDAAAQGRVWVGTRRARSRPRRPARRSAGRDRVGRRARGARERHATCSTTSSSSSASPSAWCCRLTAKVVAGVESARRAAALAGHRDAGSGVDAWSRWHSSTASTIRAASTRTASATRSDALTEERDDAADRLRIDRWLWCARFFKSRSAAAEAVRGGHVRLNGQRVKPAHAVKVGDALQIALRARRGARRRDRRDSGAPRPGAGSGARATSRARNRSSGAAKRPRSARRARRTCRRRPASPTSARAGCCCARGNAAAQRAVTGAPRVLRKVVVGEGRRRALATSRPAAASA